jgi:hypothetical protein
MPVTRPWTSGGTDGTLWTVGAEVRSLEPQLPVVEARFYGGNTRDEMAGAMLECLAIAQDRDMWLLLTDCTDLIKAPTLADIKELIDAVPLMGLDPSFREALVRPTDVTAAVAVDYWAKAGTNRGLAMEVFRDRDAALAWLTS